MPSLACDFSRCIRILTSMGALIFLMAACSGPERNEEPPAPQNAPEPASPTPAPPPPLSMNSPEKLYSLTARSLGFQLDLVEVRIVGGEIWTLATLHYPTGMVGMALEELELHAALPADVPQGRHLIIGESQGIFEPPTDLVWIKSKDDLPPEWFGGQPVPQP